MKLIQGDCLEVMMTLPAQSVDAIITDLPYGTTACKWDSVIPFAPMWEAVRHVMKPKGAFVTTASQPFTSALVMSNPKMFSYQYYWVKNRASGFLDARRRPLNNVEDVLIFCDGQSIYNPQMRQGDTHKRGAHKRNKPVEVYSSFIDKQTESNEYFPNRLLDFGFEKSTHPTQKPVALYEYLIRTYTNEGDTVLDMTMGSGTAGIACQNTGREFIGIERDPDYFLIAKQRLGA